MAPLGAEGLENRSALTCGEKLGSEQDQPVAAAEGGGRVGLVLVQLPEHIPKTALSWWLKHFGYVPAGCKMHLTFFLLVFIRYSSDLSYSL